MSKRVRRSRGVVRYRHKGGERTGGLRGPILILQKVGEQIIARPAQFELAEQGELNLLNCPVIRIRQRATHRLVRIREFLKEVSHFAGAFVFVGTHHPGETEPITAVYAMSEEVLRGKSVSGQVAEEKYRDARWVDGRYVADVVLTLDGNPVSVLQRGVQIEQTPEVVCEYLFSEASKHPVSQELSKLIKDFTDVFRRAVRYNPGGIGMAPRERVWDRVLQWIAENGFRTLTDLPEATGLSIDDVLPGISEEAVRNGSVHVPGIGTRQIVGWQGCVECGMPYVEITLHEMATLDGWLLHGVAFMVTDFNDKEHIEELRKLLKGGAVWGELCAWVAEKWKNIQRERCFPRPRTLRSGEHPEPVVWGTDPFTNKPWWAYPEVRGGKNGNTVVWHEQERKTIDPKVLGKLFGGAAKVQGHTRTDNAKE